MENRRVRRRYLFVFCLICVVIICLVVSVTSTRANFNHNTTVESIDDLFSTNLSNIYDAIVRVTHRHELVVYHEYEPTCNSYGYSVYGCVCGHRYVADELVPTDHVWSVVTTMDSTCVDLGYTKYVCDCGTEFVEPYGEYGNHIWGSWVVDTYATPSSEGLRSRSCQLCGAVDTEVIAKISSAYPYLGRWVIPSVGVNVAVYRQYGNGQAICDAWDSASLFYARSNSIMGDHVNQGFDAIKSCSSGTTAYMLHEDGSKTYYVCVGVIQGHNNGEYLTDADGNYLYSQYSNTMICYTCNDSWRNITIVLFEPA